MRQLVTMMIQPQQYQMFMQEKMPMASGSLAHFAQERLPSRFALYARLPLPATGVLLRAAWSWLRFAR
jgi:hypothetical protein